MNSDTITYIHCKASSHDLVVVYKYVTTKDRSIR